MHEIVHLSFGNSSAYSTTQYFNQQEHYFILPDSEWQAIDQDVSYRVGEGYENSQTYTPRLLLCDLRANFGSIKKVNDLYQQPGNYDDSEHKLDDISGARIEYQKQASSRRRYQDAFESGQEPAPPTSGEIVSWSDFNRSYFHPRKA